MSEYVAYYRVSTQGQGRSGLGLDAQRESVQTHVQRVFGTICAEYTDIESGANAARPQLQAALLCCKATKSVLVIAKLDRLARNVHFISQLMESGVEFVAVDMPHANKLVIHILAAMAEYERDLVSQRTKAALAAAKARGAQLGNPKLREVAPKGSETGKTRANEFAANVMPLIDSIRATGICSYRGLATALQARGIPTQRKGTWTAAGVRNIVFRGQRLA